ncbi:DUF1036 domain-containing protein [Paenibacillus donghaensis]|uniref:DUF1036 domain-containing protein n=1 Tax=Paenibacillus donghaensis TaxID=414771 RepID=A0A2Z2K8G7_9BACL|nr:DUF1036 domain-containing protein [Paenibacillus donghaensis]ASA21557.1 hypothetical protein B9T62_12680 [Paenibacillus donghaensis]
MGFYVQNNTPNVIWVAVGHYDPDCSPTTYVKEGWYRIVPGRRSLIVTGTAANQRFYIYGYDNFNNIWGGNFNTYVPSTVFTMCWVERCQGAGCRRVGFNEVIVGNSQNYTLTLTNRAQGTAKSRNTMVSRKGAAKFKLGRLSIKKSPGKLGKLGRVIRPLRSK